MELMEGLKRAKQERCLQKLATLSGVGYSYVSKLASGHSPVDRIGPVYRKALEEGLRKLFSEGGAKHAS